MNSYVYELEVTGTIGEISYHRLADDGLDYCIENLEEFEDFWSEEDLSESAKEIFEDPDYIGDWSEGSEGVYVFEAGFEINITVENEITSLAKINQSDLTLISTHNSGFSETKDQPDDYPILVLMTHESNEGWGKYILELSEEIDPTRIHYTCIQTPFGNILANLCYQTQDNKLVIADSDPECDAFPQAISAKAGWQSSKHFLDVDFDWQHLEKSLNA